MRRLDVNRPDFAAILPHFKIRAGPKVRVVKPEPRGLRCEGDASRAVRWDVRGPFLRGAIDVARNELAMPMELFWDSRFVVNIDHDPAPFP